jgi:prophage maintenance system killer protein
MTLEGGGLLENAESCYLTLQGLQLGASAENALQMAAKMAATKM